MQVNIRNLLAKAKLKIQKLSGRQNRFTQVKRLPKPSVKIEFLAGNV